MIVRVAAVVVAIQKIIAAAKMMRNKWTKDSRDHYKTR
jgi:hypothetical protein